MARLLRVSTLKNNKKMTMIDISKKISLAKLTAKTHIQVAGLNLNSAQVVVVLDASKSMHAQYKDGRIQNLLERLTGLAMALDKDQSFELYLFGSEVAKLPALDGESVAGYVDREIMGKYRINQSTNYAPAIARIHKDYFGSKDPVLVVFITDGDATDKKQTEKVITQVCTQNYYFQFCGVGGERFAFLEKLDTLKNRPIDNTGFFAAQTLEGLTDEAFFSSLLEEYSSWVRDYVS